MKALELTNSNHQSIQGKKERDVYVQVYNVGEKIFYDQIGQVSVQSQGGFKYVMIMVEIYSNGILVEPMKSRKDSKTTRAYQQLINRLNLAGITLKKHVLENEISMVTKQLIRKEYKV